MKMKNIWKFLIPASSLSTPLIAVSCGIEYPDDRENIIWDNTNENKNNIKKIELQNSKTIEINQIYSQKISQIFSDVKSVYRNYRKYYVKLIRKIEALRTKVSALIIDQGNSINSEKIQQFYIKWLEEAGKNKSKLAKLFDKYQLIFDDVDAVLNDVNLVFDNQQFIKFIETIDNRLSGKDINLGQLQKAIISSWNFLKNNLFNESKISRIEDLQNINIESDKNSHSHSHAIINLIFEMGLWHILLKNNVKNEAQINELKQDFLILKQNVIDNIGQKNYEDDFNFIVNLFEGNMEFDEKNNLINIEFQNQAKNAMEQIKAILIEIAKKEGIENKINLR
ncbi:HxHSH motif-containing lipoprotein [Mycoplasmopsis arginini]|uniref:HxHSH motif-containing lipoprotein n=1 Tax=Mycoplasmopsis arginini TaxID=2094 RepID=UPI001F393B03